jgi:hypothetical protein
MEKSILDNGKVIKWRDKENLLGLIIKNIKGTLLFFKKKRKKK